MPQIHNLSTQLINSPIHIHHAPTGTNSPTQTQTHISLNTCPHNIHSTHAHTHTHLVSHLLDGSDGGAVQVVLVAAGLDEEMGLNVLLHLLHTCHEMVVPSVRLSLSWTTGGVWRETVCVYVSERVRE